MTMGSAPIWKIVPPMLATMKMRKPTTQRGWRHSGGRASMGRRAAMRCDLRWIVRPAGGAVSGTV